MEVSVPFLFTQCMPVPMLGDTMIAFASGRSVILVSSETGQIAASFSVNGEVTQISPIGPNSNILIVATREQISMLDVATRTRIFCYDADKDFSETIKSFSIDGNEIGTIYILTRVIGGGFVGARVMKITSRGQVTEVVSFPIEHVNNSDRYTEVPMILPLCLHGKCLFICCYNLLLLLVLGDSPSTSISFGGILYCNASGIVGVPGRPAVTISMHRFTEKGKSVICSANIDTLVKSATSINLTNITSKSSLRDGVKRCPFNTNILRYILSLKNTKNKVFYIKNYLLYDEKLRMEQEEMRLSPGLDKGRQTKQEIRLADVQNLTLVGIFVWHIFQRLVRDEERAQFSQPVVKVTNSGNFISREPVKVHRCSYCLPVCECLNLDRGYMAQPSAGLNNSLCVSGGIEGVLCIRSCAESGQWNTRFIPRLNGHIIGIRKGIEPGIIFVLLSTNELIIHDITGSGGSGFSHSRRSGPIVPIIKVTGPNLSLWRGTIVSKFYSVYSPHQINGGLVHLYDSPRVRDSAYGRSFVAAIGSAVGNIDVVYVTKLGIFKLGTIGDMWSVESNGTAKDTHTFWEETNKLKSLKKGHGTKTSTAGEEEKSLSLLPDKTSLSSTNHLYPHPKTVSYVEIGRSTKTKDGGVDTVVVGALAIMWKRGDNIFVADKDYTDEFFTIHLIAFSHYESNQDDSSENQKDVGFASRVISFCSQPTISCGECVKDIVIHKDVDSPVEKPEDGKMVTLKVECLTENFVSEWRVDVEGIFMDGIKRSNFLKSISYGRGSVQHSGVTRTKTSMDIHQLSYYTTGDGSLSVMLTLESLKGNKKDDISRSGSAKAKGKKDTKKPGDKGLVVFLMSSDKKEVIKRVPVSLTKVAMEKINSLDFLQHKNTGQGRPTTEKPLCKLLSLENSKETFDQSLLVIDSYIYTLNILTGETKLIDTDYPQIVGETRSRAKTPKPSSGSRHKFNNVKTCGGSIFCTSELLIPSATKFEPKSALLIKRQGGTLRQHNFEGRVIGINPTSETSTDLLVSSKGVLQFIRATDETIETYTPNFTPCNIGFSVSSESQSVTITTKGSMANFISSSSVHGSCVFKTDFKLSPLDGCVINEGSKLTNSGLVLDSLFNSVLEGK